MGFIASNGTYMLDIHSWYLGESRWDVNVTLYKNSTMPDPYVYSLSNLTHKNLILRTLYTTLAN
jgi:hypothetical protein